MCTEHFDRYHANGTVSQSYHIKNGELDGAYKSFNPDGTLFRSIEYKEGVRHGKAMYFDGWGNLIKCKFYDSGTWHGEFMSTDISGTIYKHCFYNHGVLIELKSLVQDINNLTEDEVFTLSLLFGSNFIGANKYQ